MTLAEYKKIKNEFNKLVKKSKTKNKDLKKLKKDLDKLRKKVIKQMGGNINSYRKKVAELNFNSNYDKQKENALNELNDNNRNRAGNELNHIKNIYSNNNTNLSNKAETYRKDLTLLIMSKGKGLSNNGFKNSKTIPKPFNIRSKKVLKNTILAFKLCLGKEIESSNNDHPLYLLLQNYQSSNEKNNALHRKRKTSDMTDAWRMGPFKIELNWKKRTLVSISGKKTKEDGKTKLKYSAKLVNNRGIWNDLSSNLDSGNTTQNQNPNQNPNAQEGLNPTAPEWNPNPNQNPNAQEGLNPTAPEWDPNPNQNPNAQEELNPNAPEWDPNQNPNTQEWDSNY